MTPVAKKNQVRSINSFSTAKTWQITFTNARVFVEMVPYIRTVARDFFWIQFKRKFKFSRTPVFFVDNPLDQKIPFCPERIGDYLGFVNYWIRPLGMLVTLMGKRRASFLVAEFFNRLKKCYKAAGQVYKECLTTTKRPRYYKKIYFAAVHVLDPHLLCVPSLHIAVVVLCWAFFRRVLADPFFSEEERTLWNRELYDHGIVIAETVLYVKQHSVNCIAAALYMMTRIMPELFCPDDALAFIDAMFVKRKDIPATDREQIAHYMKALFKKFCAQGNAGADWSQPVIQWIRDDR